MKIVHISISDPYVDGWGYQANLLPKYLQKRGVQNVVVASSTHFPAYLKQETIDSIRKNGCDYSIDGVEVKRIPTGRVSSSFIYPKGLMKILEEINPDAIFHHNFNCSSLPISAKYAKKHNIPMVVDNHADTINMTKHKLWQWFYYKLLIGGTCKIYKNQIFKAYGVTHARCDFIHYFYGLTKEKIDFLPIGADVDLADTLDTKSNLRLQYGFNETDFVVVSGGKMGLDKRTDHLIEAVEELSSDYPQLKLALFGAFEDKELEKQASKTTNVSLFGWLDRKKTLELLKMANVACWPYHHTTLIEDAVSVCTPIISRKTGTTEHLIEGNGAWVENGSKDEIKEVLIRILTQNKEKKIEMSRCCESIKKSISYRTVVQKVLDDLSHFRN